MICLPLSSRGLTIDTISCVSIVLVIGLCVDYNSHIAHAYIVSFGSSRERATHALTEIGPAVLNGAITTFLALVFLAFSQGYAFIVFFRCVSLIVHPRVEDTKPSNRLI